MQAAILGLYDPDRSEHPLAEERCSGSARSAAKKTWADFVAAWKAASRSAYLASGGEGLAVLAAPSASPTLFRLAGRLRQRFPNVRWATWEPVSEENALAGAALLAGRPLRPAYDLGAARVVVSLDADLLLAESDAVAHARGFAAGRRLASEKEAMNRLWVVESAFTTTGAMADHRLALPSGRIGAFALALGQALAAAGGGARRCRQAPRRCPACHQSGSRRSPRTSRPTPATAWSSRAGISRPRCTPWRSRSTPRSATWAPPSSCASRST